MHKSVVFPVCPSLPVPHLIFKPTGQFLLNFTEKDIKVKRLTCTYKIHVCMCGQGQKDRLREGDALKALL